MFSSRKKTSSTVASNPSALGLSWGEISSFALPSSNKENSFRSNSKHANHSPFEKRPLQQNYDMEELILNNERLSKQNHVLEAELKQRD